MLKGVVFLDSTAVPPPTRGRHSNFALNISLHLMLIVHESGLQMGVLFLTQQLTNPTSDP